MTDLGTEVTWCADLGMFALNRPREVSCTHRTPACDGCYNEKLETAFGHTIHPKDKKNEIAWQGNDALSLRESLAKRKRQTKRFRLMSRGESFSGLEDVSRVENILQQNPDTVFWTPTRAWHDPVLWANVRDMCARHKNVRLLASTDVYTTDSDWAKLKRQGVSTMFFGDDDMRETPNGDRMFICPKTHRKMHGHCAICKAGCFNDKRTDVHLKSH